MTTKTDEGADYVYYFTYGNGVYLARKGSSLAIT